MQLSKLMQELQAVVDEHGDLPVLTSMYSDRDNTYTFDDFGGIGDDTYELKEGDEYEEYIGCRADIFGKVLIINYGEY